MNMDLEKKLGEEELVKESTRTLSKIGSIVHRGPVGYTSDIVVLIKPKSQKEYSMDTVKIMLIQRREKDAEGNPNAEGGKWAIPGGFVDSDETGLEAGIRELEEETKVSGISIKHFGVYDKPKRDPRGWIISNAHYAVVDEEKLSNRKAGDDAKQLKLVSLKEAFEMELAFDHRKIIEDAIKASNIFGNE